MGENATFLRGHVDDIVRRALDIVDADQHEALLRGLVGQLATRLEDPYPLELGELRGAGLDEGEIRRILRAIQAACIEVGRIGHDGDFHEFVLSLRPCVREALPSPTIEPDHYRLYEIMMAEESGAEPEHPCLPLFRNIMLTLRDMVYLHDSDGNLLYINEYGLDMTRYSHEDLRAGLNVYDFICPEYLDVVEARLESPGTVMRAPYTIEVYAKDGERIPVDIDTRLLSEKDPVGGPVVGIIRDLRLERRLEESIQAINERFDSLTSNAPIGIVIADATGVILEVNPNAVTLCGAPDERSMLGLSVCALCEEDEVLTREELDRILEGVGSLRERIHTRTRFGGSLDCDLFVAPLRRRRVTHGLLVLMVDVSKELALRRNLLHSERLSALGEIVSGVAHELNNPLTSILGNAQLSLMTENDAAKRNRLDKIAEESQRCIRIVGNLLAFAQHCELERTSQDINVLIKETLDLCEYQLRTDQIALAVDLSPDVPPVEVCAQELKRVILSLVSNAHKALVGVSRRERKLIVTTGLDEDLIRIRFQDNGCGLAPDLQEKVFDPFFTTSEAGEGPGLGLSVAYGIIEEHGGHIDLTSEQGKGTTVTIALPVP